jgi:hypothetical protein
MTSEIRVFPLALQLGCVDISLMLTNIHCPLLLACFIALSLGNVAFAGSAVASAGKAKCILPLPEPEVDVWELEMSAGFDSHYIFRGERLQENTPWGQLSLDVPLAENLCWNLTPWYLYAPDGDFNEFDFNSALTYTLHEYEFSIGYASYYYPKGAEGGGLGRGDEQEFSLGLCHKLWSLEASALAVYNAPRDGFYYEFKLAQPFEINDTFSLNLSVLAGLDSHYFDESFDWNHVLGTLEMPVKLSEHLALSPYVALNLPGGHLDYESTQWFGGVKMAWTW